jgi:hypothetical protein
VSWKKIPIKLPFLEEVTQLFSALKSGADAVSTVLEVGVTALNIAKAVYLAKADPFLFIFQALLSQLEDLINDTFNQGYYTLIVDPRKVSGLRITETNAAFATSVSVVDDQGNPVPASEIAARALALEEAGLDPTLTYKDMRAKVTEKRKNWKFDNFGIPLMTPSQCVNHMIASLDDTGDPMRPVFSDTAQVSALGFIVTAPDIEQFVALAEPLLAILEIDQLADLLNEFLRRSNRTTAEPSGGTAPDWTANGRLADIEFLRQQRDALLGALAQIKGAVESADQAVVRLIDIITEKLNALNEVVESFSALLTKLQSILDAEGVFVFELDSNGGTNLIKQQLKAFDASASDIFALDSGYTFGVLFVGGGPSYESVKLLQQLFLDLRTQALLGGANAKQKVTFSAVPEGPNSSLTIGEDGSGNGVKVVFVDGDGNKPTPVQKRQALQEAVKTSGLAQEAVVLLAPASGGTGSSGGGGGGGTEIDQTKNGTDDQIGFNALVQAEKTELGFTVEFQGQDGRQPQPLLDFTDPGKDTIIELCFSEPPTSGSFTLVFDGVETTPIPYTATAADLEMILNDTEGLYNKVTVTGSFEDCFLITIKNKAVSAPTAGSNSLVGVNPVGVTATVQQAGRDPASSLIDRDGRPITVKVESLVDGRQNDLCE